MLLVECFKQPSLSYPSFKVDRLLLCTISAISCSSDDIGALRAFPSIAGTNTHFVVVVVFVVGMLLDPRRKLRFRKLALGSHSSYDASKKEFLQFLILEKNHNLLLLMYRLF